MVSLFQFPQDTFTHLPKIIKVTSDLCGRPQGKIQMRAILKDINMANYIYSWNG